MSPKSKKRVVVQRNIVRRSLQAAPPQPQSSPPPRLKKLPLGERRISGYGWHPELPDHRDLVYAVPAHVTAAALPPLVDLRSQCPPVYNQLQLGSCTANAIAAAIQFEQMKQNLPVFTPSRLFIYYNERVMEHTVTLDHGAQIRDGIKSVAQQGVCPETAWPYDDKNMDNKPCPECPYAKKPTPTCYKTAKGHKVMTYQRLTPTLDVLKGCLASGYPFVFGFTVYTAFESKQVEKSGMLAVPGPNEKVMGGHAVMAVGYNDTTQQFIIRNSWGDQWGLNGYFMMPYTYLTNTNLADDFWTIRLVE